MIKTKAGNVTIDGTLGELLGDFVVVTAALHEAFWERHGESKSKTILEDAFKSAFKTDDELKEDIHKLIEDIFS